MTQDTQTMRFRCPSCSASMRADKAEAGEKRKCPKCKTTFRIPQLDGAPKSKPKKKEQPLVPVVCGVCNTRIYANLDQVGTSVECPDCFTQNLVKPPEKKKAKKGPDLEKIGEYGLAPAQEVKVIQTMGEDKLGEADEFVQREIEEAPQLPDKPFLHGIFTYPFRGSVLPTLLSMAMAWTFFLLVVDGAWGLEGMSSVVAPFILGGAAFFFTLVVIPSFVAFQNIMEHGANGDDETEIRPEGGLFTMGEWIVDVLPIGIAATVSCVPTLGVFHLLLATSGNSIPWSWVIEFGVSFMAYLLFPVILLSMLENNSIMGVYSRQVWGSLVRQPISWLKFWVIATLLYGVLLVVGLAFIKLRELDWSTMTISGMILAMSVLVGVLAIYFRVLGRLAFVLTSRPISEKSRSRADAALA